jgi:hypothetical protein
MKTHQRIAFLWILCLIVIFADKVVCPAGEELKIAVNLIEASSALIGIVSYYLWKLEIRKGARWMFLNFAVFYGCNGLVTPIFEFVIHSLGISGDWLEIFFIQYYYLSYFLFLFICVFYVAVDEIASRRGVVKNYTVTLLVTGCVWGMLSYSFFINPKFLLTEPNYRDFNSVREAMQSLQDSGKPNPSPQLIAAEIDLRKSTHQPPLASMSKIEKQHRVEEILPYVPGKSGYLIFFAPLWIRCSIIGMLSVLLLVWSSARQYIVDSQNGAYVEKITWCLMLYCILEALHFYAYTQVKDHASFLRIDLAGSYLSLVVMWILGGLFALRLRFIQSVEGGYYERRLLESADGITRWRDELDNWLLRNFMNPNEFDRRFLIQRKVED